MSLDWNLTKIKDYETVCWVDPETVGSPARGIWTYNDQDKALNPVTYSIIWGTMAVGIGQIKESNLDEFFTRLHIWESVTGKDNKTTYEQLKQHIGLNTNVFPKESTAAFMEKMQRYIMRNCKS
jgi:hypothetical protein